MKHKVDLNTWPRRGNWGFMRVFANGWCSETSEVDCPGALGGGATRWHLDCPKRPCRG
ncbi:hypothetical protein [Prevotella sp. S7-1-8]|uniref:hypothetical protein n=1 Tax=Prevotella sp. S7-1-8 TaxID=1284775 RepID=UPI000AE465C6|nr:hypothetical protein [Prevotella sp. S7-1-8]